MFIGTMALSMPSFFPTLNTPYAALVRIRVSISGGYGYVDTPNLKKSVHPRPLLMRFDCRNFGCICSFFFLLNYPYICWLIVFLKQNRVAMCIAAYMLIVSKQHYTCASLEVAMEQA